MFYRRELIFNLRFIQIPSKWLKNDKETQVNNGTFIFIADKVSRFPVVDVLLFD